MLVLHSGQFSHSSGHHTLQENRKIFCPDFVSCENWGWHYRGSLGGSEKWPRFLCLAECSKIESWPFQKCPIVKSGISKMFDISSWTLNAVSARGVLFIHVCTEFQTKSTLHFEFHCHVCDVVPIQKNFL